LIKLRSLVIALVVAAAASTVHAQGALYIAPIAYRISNSTLDTSLFSFLGPTSTSRMFYGVQFGGFYDIPQSQKGLEIGVDLRDSIVHGNSAALNSFLVGLRLAPTKYGKLRPYVEPFVGVGSSRAPHTSIRVNQAQYGGMVGVDYAFSHNVGWRVAEVGYSSLRTASAGTIGGTADIPNAGLLSISSGLTFRLP
jgi:hypothetical protein